MLRSWPRFLLLALLLTAVALAGCTSDDAPVDEADDQSDGGDSGADGSAGAGAAAGDEGAGADNGTVEPTVDRSVALSVNQSAGSVPLNVSFNVGAEGLDDGAAWILSFGDGGDASGSGADLPAVVNHTYATGGNFTANFTVTYGDGETLGQQVNVTAALPPGAGAPEVVHFEFGQALGCAGDVLGIVDSAAGLGLNCHSFREGPEADPVDGFWLPLDERYWGMALSSTTDQGAGAGGAEGFLGDSDCVFTDADFAVVGEANGGSGSCEGAVPEGTAWLFAYYYATPGVALVIDFA